MNYHHVVIQLTFNNRHLFASPAMPKQCQTMRPNQWQSMLPSMSPQWVANNGLQCGRGKKVLVVEGENCNKMMVIHIVPPPADRPYKTLTNIEM